MRNPSRGDGVRLLQKKYFIRRTIGNWQLGRVALAFLLLTASVPLLGTQEVRKADEYAIRSAYIYNFLSFTTWDTTLFSHDTDTIRITILGEKRLEESITSLQGKQFRGKVLDVHIIESINAFQPSHVVYIGKSQQDSYQSLNREFSSKGILTLGEGNSFLKEGGDIAFVENNNTIRFSIDLSNAKASRLDISSQLIQLAVEVFK